MKVFLAGYNVDAEVIEEMKLSNGNRQDATPETLSAAYARISRDPRPINELRQAARIEVDKSRKSNTSIIFGLGHSSVAEHAVFNFDIINISRYAMEEVEKFRLCSFTEKSQRYITLDSDFLVPPEIKGSKLENEFIEVIRKQHELYYRLFVHLKTYVLEQYKDLAKDPKNNNLLEGWAKEDARYITSLSTFSQVGMTINARNLEKMIRRFSVHPLVEIQNLSKALHTLVKDVAPSVIKYPAGNDYEKNTYPELLAEITKLTANIKNNTQKVKPCILHYYPKNGDELVLAGLMHHLSSLSYTECLATVKKLSRKNKMDIFKASVKNMKFFDQLVREFELAELLYEMTVSGACFGQLKRHRMATVISQDYAPKLGLVIPPAIAKIGFAAEFKKVADESAAFYQKLKMELPIAADYILTNAHQRRVLFKTNLRELYHISRLREDEHAQWDIREKTVLMTAAARKALPICTSLIGGKDKFQEIFAKVFN